MTLFLSARFEISFLREIFCYSDLLVAASCREEPYSSGTFRLHTDTMHGDAMEIDDPIFRTLTHQGVEYR